MRNCNFRVAKRRANSMAWLLQESITWLLVLETYRKHRTKAKKDHACIIWLSGWFYPDYKDKMAVSGST